MVSVVLSLILQFAGPLFFIGLQLSSVSLAYKLRTEKSVGNYSLIPFLSLLCNSFVWSLYGLLKESATILVPNILGVLSGFYCVTSYNSVAVSSSAKLHTLSLFVVVLALILAFNGDSFLVGMLGCGMSVALMGAPLATLSVVIRDRSTASLPFATTMANLGNAVSWGLYGALVAHDPMVYGPNAIGLVLCSMQVLLYLVYGLPPLPSDNIKGGNSTQQLLSKI